MTYRTILAYVDDADRCKALIEVTKAMGERHEAHVIGLHVVPNIQIYAASEPQLQSEVFEIQREANEAAVAAAEKVFNGTMKGAKCTTEWRRVEQGGETIGDRVTEHALIADLVITGQIDPEIESPRRVGTPETVLMYAGRPLLMIPYVGSYAEVGRHVMIAWKPSPGAARAVFDALPVLREAEQVTILEIDPDETPEAALSCGAGALAASLARHGVKAKTHRTPSGDIGVGAALLSRLADEGADLLVMGGYGHSRFSEYLFGGATREVLKQMTVPVLISH